ncbi:uncharacterized protein LOC131317063 [Rhododendron vialii]|uniref:uncharacterized protein LOC131317063 n=1 Tax=Rhododendron vialii TaxID=182163 RepID=UPI00265EB451|nr:uncharacterized protein LOC131317063 [Rhododendron vialii]
MRKKENKENKNTEHRRSLGTLGKAARNFKNGLETGSKILDELAIRAPHGMNELMRTVEQFYSYEEFLAERELQGGQNSTAPQSLHIPTPQIAPPKPVVAVQPKKQVNTVKMADKKGPKAHDYIAEITIFKEPIYFFLPTLEREPFFVWPNPPKLNTEEGNNNSRKRCSYHNELGHYTTACAPYKALLENLAAQGLLDDHIDWTKTPSRQPNAGGPNPIPRPVGVINVIHGPTTKEAAKQLRLELDKAHKVTQIFSLDRAPKKMKMLERPWSITFTEQDLQRVQTPHSDALVVTVQILTHFVKRVLIDQGSSAEVMYLSLFKELKIPESCLLPAEVPLIGFSGTPVWPLGRITLPVVTGSVASNLEFVVVDAPSPSTLFMSQQRRRQQNSFI